MATAFARPPSIRIDSIRIETMRPPQRPQCRGPRAPRGEESYMVRVFCRLAIAALAVPLGLAGCGGSGGGGSSASVKRLRVLDYYSNEPDKSNYAKVLSACGKAI